MTEIKLEDSYPLIHLDGVDVVDDQAHKSHSQGDAVVTVEGVSKKFCRDLRRSLIYGVFDIFSELTGHRSENRNLRKGEFWALNNVNLTLHQGEALGLVGANGSGKSTLLRLISGIFKPDTGEINVRGRLAPLIALGAAFSPVLTGRENIYTNMSILGLSKQEIDERFDEVVAFAEIEEAIDSPVRTYSSGMTARLGFSSAIFTFPDILIIDEVLAVGDIRFREKCKNKLKTLRDRGTSFIIVSHHHEEIVNICDRVVYLRRGEVVSLGEPGEIMKQYEDGLLAIDEGKDSKLTEVGSQLEDSGVIVEDIFFRDLNEQKVEILESGQPISLCVKIKVERTEPEVSIFVVFRRKGYDIGRTLHTSSYHDNQSYDLDIGCYEIRLEMPYLGLRRGKYFLHVVIKSGGLRVLGYLRNKLIEVRSNDAYDAGSVYYQPRSWCLITKSSSEDNSF